MISPVFPQTRTILGRLRCVQECIEYIQMVKPLPETLCYVPGKREYKVTKVGERIPVYAEPDKKANCLGHINSTKDAKLEGSGEDMCNSSGQWLKIKEENLKKLLPGKTISSDGWILLFDGKISTEEPPLFHPIVPDKVTPAQEQLFGKRVSPICSWEEVVEVKYSLRLGPPPEIVPPDQDAVKALQKIPQNWDLVCDEELVRFLSEQVVQENEKLGNVKQYVESVAVSSSWDDESASCLTDGDSGTYWESDGRQGQHWIRLSMRKGVIIKKLFIGVDCRDENYMPGHVVVLGGEIENLIKLSDVHIEQSYTGDYCVLEEMTKYYPILEIRIKSCEDDGVDTRIHGIKIKSLTERDLGLNRDLFIKDELVRYPRLEPIDQEELYRRALVLMRFIRLLDSVIHFMIPAWEYSFSSFGSLDSIRQFLPMSKKRNSLMQHFLTQSETGKPASLPKLFINRRVASEHRQDPDKDPSGKNTVFIQVYEGLQQKDKYVKQLDYRWPKQYDQWWECKFSSEGIIDQGGGFRDSLADMAEELCPTDPFTPIPLSLFVRSPNQNNDDQNVNRDVYVPNPSCTQLAKYEWIGQLMGACLRGREHLVLSLPSFVWKKLSGETVSWSRDFASVDAAAVKLIDSIRNSDEESFMASFAEDLTYSTAISNETLIELMDHGVDVTVQYEERLQYCDLVEKTRMEESKSQIDAIRKGLLKVVPQAVLDLLTWQELERKICGDPNISMDALLLTTIFEDLDESGQRVKMFWEAIGNFTNDDRSRFLRFATGRRRLPATLYICPDKGDKKDILPESSTCSNTLFLPIYSSAKVAEEKIRYAAYNCVAIDTDMSPWDE